MRYDFEVRSVAQQGQSIEEKHCQFLLGLEGVPAPWGVERPLEAPDPGSGLSASLKVATMLGAGLRGDLVYQFRRPFRDDASQDDYLNITFNPEKIDYVALVTTVFPRYVGAFDAYYAEISDDEFTFMDHDQRRTLGIDKRHAIFRLPPVCYLHRDLCARALDMTPAQIVHRLQGSVAHLQETATGVIIALTDRPLPTMEMDALCWEAKFRLLPGGPSTQARP